MLSILPCSGFVLLLVEANTTSVGHQELQFLETVKDIEMLSDFSQEVLHNSSKLFAFRLKHLLAMEQVFMLVLLKHEKLSRKLGTF